jgi:hypothetical protein
VRVVLSRLTIASTLAEIPLLPTISAKVTFQKLQFRDDLQAKLFQIPRAYREDSNRFPDL